MAHVKDGPVLSHDSSAGGSGYTRVVILGFTGMEKNEEPHKNMSKDTFWETVKIAEDTIKRLWRLQMDSVELVCGGSSWADHVAVALFLMHAQNTGVRLALHVPAKWLGSKYEETGTGTSWKDNPGMVLNELHRKFSRCVQRDSSHDIRCATLLGGVQTNTYNSIQKSSEAIAISADRMLSFAFSADAPTEGAAKYAWNKSNLASVYKSHFDLGSLPGKSSK
jgi:hypothetical protein